MKYIVFGVILSAVAAIVISEDCEGHHTHTCIITQCVNGTLVCEHGKCGCTQPSVAGSDCVDRADCDGGSHCKIPDPHGPHHGLRKPHEHDGEWHCLDRECTCLKMELAGP